MSTNTINNSGVASALPDTTTALPSSILTTAQAQKQAAAASSANTGAGMSSLGESDFLTLFTTQLKDQDPLNPSDGANFVSQLAQFSQLEATTSMSTQMSSLVSSLSGETLMSSAMLMGSQVAVPGAPETLTNGTASPALISLPNGASSVTVQVKDSSGNLVNSYRLGAQTAGNLSWTWDGQNLSGSTASNGNYTLSASAVVNGATTTPTISTMQTVSSVTQSSSGAVMLNVSSGQSVAVGSVQMIQQ